MVLVVIALRMGGHMDDRGSPLGLVEKTVNLMVEAGCGPEDHVRGSYSRRKSSQKRTWGSHRASSQDFLDEEWGRCRASKAYDMVKMSESETIASRRLTRRYRHSPP
jgi:hypothetical protein